MKKLDTRPLIVEGIPLVTPAMAWQDAMQRAFDAGYLWFAIEHLGGDRNRILVFKRLGPGVCLEHGAIFSELVVSLVDEGWVWGRKALPEKSDLTDSYHNIRVLMQWRDVCDWTEYATLLAVMSDGAWGIPMNITVPEGFDVPRLAKELAEWRDPEA